MSATGTGSAPRAEANWRPDPALPVLRVPAANREPRRAGRRPDLLLLHYTGMTSCAKAIDWLAREDSRVSCHYVVDLDGTITQMVPEAERAWHAGVSAWHGETDINSCSIGIEIHNPGPLLGPDGGCPAYPEPQMAAVVALCRDIVGRWRIPPERVLGHSDVAPLRKEDPGEHFDWPRLARAGIGLWVEPAPVTAPDQPVLEPYTAGPAVAVLQRRLAAFGYGLPVTGRYDDPTAKVVTAFQRHWRPARVDGRADASTLATLARLDAARRGGPSAVSTSSGGGTAAT